MNGFFYPYGPFYPYGEQQQPQMPQMPQMQQQPQQQEYYNEQSYIENILRLNLGKVVNIYMNFESSQWGSKIFKGVLEAAGKDHIIISDPATGMRYILLTIYLDYITFDSEIDYYYPYEQNRAK